MNKSTAQLKVDDAAVYFDNNTDGILPVAVRQHNIDILDSFYNKIDNPSLGLSYTAENTANKATDLSSNDNTHYTTTAAVNNGITAESAIRAGSDNTLTTNLNAEAANRTNADNILSANMSTETTNRIAGDAANATSITTNLSNANAYTDSNTQQATETLRGTAKIVTQAIIETPATTNDTDAVTAKKFWFGFAKGLTLTSFFNAVSGTILTGLSSASSAVVTVTDSIIGAIGKLQEQIKLRALDSAVMHLGGASGETVTSPKTFTDNIDVMGASKGIRMTDAPASAYSSLYGGVLTVANLANNLFARLSKDGTLTYSNSVNGFAFTQQMPTPTANNIVSWRELAGVPALLSDLNGLVHLAGVETISGAKTFTATISSTNGGSRKTTIDAAAIAIIDLTATDARTNIQSFGIQCVDANTGFIEFHKLGRLSYYSYTSGFTFTQQLPTTVTADNTVTWRNVSGVPALLSDLSAYAPLNNAALVGVPVAPTAAVGTNTTQLATTEFVQAAKASPRVLTITSGVNVGIYGSDADVFLISGLSTNLNFSSQGYFYPYQEVTIIISDNGTARSISWNGNFNSYGAVLPTTTIASKMLFVKVMYIPGSSTYACMSVINQL